MTDCPELGALEAAPVAVAVQMHVAECTSCRLVVELFEMARGVADADRDCLRFDALLAARGDGTLGRAGVNLLERHLAGCAACRAVADTLSPTTDAHGDHATFPKVDPGAYALGLEVARGGMGRILAARDLRVGRPVAVKELLGRSPQLAARFEREARVTARLQHPGIVPIYEIGQWPDGTPFYSMRMVDGGTLREAIARAGSLAARIGLLPAVIAATEAVAFAHGQRVIHRDLTPSNVLVGAYGETVVIDWGLAKDLADAAPDPEREAGPYRSDPSDELTGVGAVIGTAAYMPPEQANAETVDERADVYALGAILYHLLAGAAPYRTRAPMPTPTQETVDVAPVKPAAVVRPEDLLRELKAGPPTPIDVVAPGAPRDLVSIVTKAMSRDANARYPSARELADELKRYQTGRMVEAHAYSRGEKIKRFLLRHRGAVTVTALATVVLAATAAISVSRVLRSKADANRTAQELLLDNGRSELLAGNPLRSLAYLNEAYRHGDTPALQFLLASALGGVARPERTFDCGGDVRFLAFSPDGAHVAAACHDVAKVWPLDGGKPIASLGPFPGGFDAIGYSHDGKTIATWGADGIARLWDARSGVLQRAVDHGDQITFTTFTPDDLRIATSGYDGTAQIWDLPTGVKIRTIVASTAWLHHLYGLLSPDGKHLLTVTIEGEGKGWDVESGALLGGFSHGAFIGGGELSPDGTLAVTCGLDRLTKVWDATTGALRLTLGGHTDVVWKCVFSPDGTRLLTTGHDGRANVYELATGALIVSVTHGDIGWTGSFSPDGRRFVTVGVGDNDNVMAKVWDASSGALLASHDTVGGRDARFSRDSRRLVTERGDGRIEIWAEPSSQVLSSFTPPAGASVLAVSHDGGRAIVETGDGWVTVWDTALAHRFEHVAIHGPVALATDRLAAVTEGGVAILDLHGATLVAKLPLARAPDSLELSADGTRLIVVPAPGASPEVWDIARRTTIAILDHATRAIPSEDGRRAIAWSPGGPAVVWDVDRRRAIATMTPRGKYRSIGFAAGGTRVAFVEGVDEPTHTVTLWNADDGDRLLEAVDTSYVPGFDPGHRMLTTIGKDHTVTVWDASDGRVRSSFPGGQLLQTQVDATGSLIVAIGEYGTAAIVMDASDGHMLARWPIEHPGPFVSETGFKPPRGLAWWSRDGKSIVSESKNIAVWHANATKTRDELATFVARHVPWRFEDGHLARRNNGRLKGHVMRDGAPVANAKIAVEFRTPPDVGSEPVSWESTKTQVTKFPIESRSDGSFEHGELFPGEYTLTVTAEGLTSATEVHVGIEDEDVIIDLTHGP